MSDNIYRAIELLSNTLKHYLPRNEWHSIDHHLGRLHGLVEKHTESPDELLEKPVGNHH